MTRHVPRRLGHPGARASLALALALLAIPALTLALAPDGPTRPGSEIRDLLRDGDGLQPVNVLVEPVRHLGRRGVQVTAAGGPRAQEETLAVVLHSAMTDGVIELELTWEPAPGSPAGSRGFVGVAFRAREVDGHWSYEAIYLRPENGRAPEQIRRNHAVQYVSHPAHPWHRLRAESPGVYESYVDLVPGAWTRVRIEVSGTQARLFVHDAPQPTLIVQDLKLGTREGHVALWLHSSTRARFRGLSVRSTP